MPSRSPFGARMQWPEPAYTEQSLARLARPTKGGAVRIRIALATTAVVIVTPAILFAFFSSQPAASPQPSRHEAASQHRTVRIDDTLMSYAQARNASKFISYTNAVEASQVRTYLSEMAYLQSLATARQQQAAAQAAAAAAAPARAHQAAAPAPAAAPVPAPAAGGSDATSTATADWACIRQHESGDNYAIGNGGAYQFELGTWTALTGLPSPAQDYPAAVQDAAALKLYGE